MLFYSLLLIWKWTKSGDKLSICKPDVINLTFTLCYLLSICHECVILSYCFYNLMSLLLVIFTKIGILLSKRTLFLKIRHTMFCFEGALLSICRFFPFVPSWLLPDMGKQMGLKGKSSFYFFTFLPFYLSNQMSLLHKSIWFATQNNWVWRIKAILLSSENLWFEEMKAFHSHIFFILRLAKEIQIDR